MTCKMMHQICYGFYWSIKKWSKLGQKTKFLAHFVSFFVYALLYSMNTPIFCQMKDPITIYICDKLMKLTTDIAYVLVKLKFFKVPCIDSASLK